MPVRRRARRSRRNFKAPRQTRRVTKRILQSTSARVNADPASTNLTLARPYSYRVPIAVNTTISSQSDTFKTTALSDINQSAIQKVRVDRITLWGPCGTEHGDSNLTLTVSTPSRGILYSRADQAGTNQRARLCCIVPLLYRYDDLTITANFPVTGIQLTIKIDGVVYVQRSAASVPPPADVEMSELMDAENQDDGMVQDSAVKADEDVVVQAHDETLKLTMSEPTLPQQN